MKDNLLIESRGFTVNFILRERITLIRGNSATGKTLFAEMASEDSIIDDKILVMGVNSPVDPGILEHYAKNREGKLIIIDKAELYLTKDMVDIINYDYNNRYIIMGRTVLGLHATPDSIVEIEYNEKDKIFSLKYIF